MLSLCTCREPVAGSGVPAHLRGAHRFATVPPPTLCAPPPQHWSGMGMAPCHHFWATVLRRVEKHSSIFQSLLKMTRGLYLFQNWKKKGNVLGEGYLQIRLHCPATTMSLQQAAFLYRDVSETHQNMILRNRDTFHDKLLLYLLAVPWLSDMEVFKEDLFGSQSKPWHSVLKSCDEKNNPFEKLPQPFTAWQACSHRV